MTTDLNVDDLFNSKSDLDEHCRFLYERDAEQGCAGVDDACEIQHAKGRWQCDRAGDFA